MFHTRCLLFTTSQDWIVPPNVFVVLATLVGGGSGTTGSAEAFGHLGKSTGGGSSELAINRILPVTPGQTLLIIVGAKGLGTSYEEGRPSLGTPSSVGYITALNSGDFPGPFFTPGTAGAGGGPRGSEGSFGSGGFVCIGKKEACGFSGGAGGGILDLPAGVGGGPQPTRPLPSSVGEPTYAQSGTPGAGTIFGGTKGGAFGVGNVNASPSAYGASAGGSGAPDYISGEPAQFRHGGNGAPGCVILMY